MNLAVNARDAMRGVVEPGAGVVTIRTRRLELNQAKALGWAAATGEAALIEVSDTGPGVPPELLDKIFEPFFTTKAVNEGTGMGLATVYGIVQQAGGHITVSNIEGAGAAFRIFLPAATKEELIATPVVEKPAKAVPRDLSGAGRILFVEDEAAVRGIAARLLRQRGYEVIEAADGEEALALAEEWAGQIDMLISDVIMPGLDGPSLLRKARPYLGDAPVMFISGYAESDFSDLLQDEVGVSFLPKPLDIKTLAERVKQELHA
jgi:two-component system cell cycle sensor histidine kinase/response regulator CckA